jgi:biopolymer transport protein ExbB
MRAGLMAGIDRWRAQGAVQEEQLEVLPVLQRRIPLLSSLASIAMLIGLLGTIAGLIGGFHCGGAAVNADQRAVALAKSISIAINTTGFGLLVSIVLLSARVWLQSLSEGLVADVALYGARIVNLVTLATEPAPATTGTPYRTAD